MTHQPRYAHFARVNGKTPGEQHQEDKDKTGGMLDFTCWIQSRLNDLRKARPEAFLHHGLVDHAAFDNMLAGTPCRDGATVELVKCSSHRARDKLFSLLASHDCPKPSRHFWSWDRSSKGVYEIPASLLADARKITGVTRTTREAFPNS